MLEKKQKQEAVVSVHWPFEADTLFKCRVERKRELSRAVTVFFCLAMKARNAARAGTSVDSDTHDHTEFK